MVDKIWYNMEELIGGSEERVLIETYWNVKHHYRWQSIHVQKGINRNILECKGRSKESRIRKKKRINRNILECKVDIHASVSHDSQRINRNILKCKVQKIM